MIDAQGPSGTGQLGPVPYLRLPQPEVLFARRAERFLALAPGHTLSEYLELLGRLAKAQLAAWETVERACRVPTPAPVRPERSEAESRGAPGEPCAPLDVATHLRAPEWREMLRVIVVELSTRRAIPAESRAALDLLASAPADALEAIAGRVLANAAEGSDLSTGPFVAAALQVYFASLAAGIDPASVPRSAGGCPICGSLPVVGVVLGDDPLRYLVCSVCATQWHHTRVQCTACGQGQGIEYYRLEGDRAASVPSAAAVKAEACPGCKAYTKLFYLESDPRIEAFADDVATLALDLLMAENGWARHGVNLFLVPAEGEERAPA